jgi:N-terminal domain of (some) glycogen debranching enzymes
VLADAHSFAIFDAGGDIVESPLEALGLFHRDTRYLSRFELTVAGETPYFLNSFLSDDKAQFRVNLTNPDLGDHGGGAGQVFSRTCSGSSTRTPWVILRRSE